MSEQPAGTLMRLGDTDRTVADPDHDVRGRTVRDNNGADIGTVDDLLVDTGQDTVKFLQVGHGGILGFGATPSFIPVNAVVQVTDDAVHIDQSSRHVAGAPGYDPDLADQQAYYTDLYGYYGYPPFGASPTIPLGRPPGR